MAAQEDPVIQILERLDLPGHRRMLYFNCSTTPAERITQLVQTRS